MHALLLSLLGIGGVGGIAALAIFCPTFFLAAAEFLKGIPRQVWYGIAVVALVLTLYIHHQHSVKLHDTKLLAANNAQWEQRLNAEAAQLNIKSAQLAEMANQFRKANDEENALIAADARTIRLRGPGKAACPAHGPIAPPSGGPQSPGAIPDAAGSALPPADGADVSWDWLTTRAEEHDQLRLEVESWRTWYADLLKNWPKKTEAAH